MPANTIASRLSLIALGAVLGLSACASPSEDVNATYVSPLRFQGMSCDALWRENSAMIEQIAMLRAEQDERAQLDRKSFGVVPLLAGYDIDVVKRRDREPHLARAMGRANAIYAAGMAKGCEGLAPVPPAPRFMADDPPKG